MTDIKADKNTKVMEIKNLLHNFCEVYLNPAIEGYCFKLCDTLGRKRKINILQSKSEQWAASIIYVIARLNFLFDPKNEYNLTAADICDYYDTRQSTTGKKATQIEQICNLSMGEEGYCPKEITDMFTYYETEDGFILSKSMLDSLMSKTQSINNADRNTAKELPEHEESIEELRRKEIEERLADLKEKAKYRNDKKIQLYLFDD